MIENITHYCKLFFLHTHTHCKRFFSSCNYMDILLLLDHTRGWEAILMFFFLFLFFSLTSLIKLWMCVTFLVQYSLHYVPEAHSKNSLHTDWIPASLITERNKALFFLVKTSETYCMFMFNKIFFYCSWWTKVKVQLPSYCFTYCSLYKKRFQFILTIFKHIIALYFMYLYLYYYIYNGLQWRRAATRGQGQQKKTAIKSLVTQITVHLVITGDLAACTQVQWNSKLFFSAQSN